MMAYYITQNCILKKENTACKNITIFKCSGILKDKDEMISYCWISP